VVHERFHFEASFPSRGLSLGSAGSWGIGTRTEPDRGFPARILRSRSDAAATAPAEDELVETFTHELRKVKT